MKEQTLEKKVNSQCWVYKYRDEGSSITNYKTNNKDYLDKVLENVEVVPYKGKNLLVEKEYYTLCSDNGDEIKIRFKERTNVIGYVLLKYDSSYILSPEKPILTKYLKSKLRKKGFDTHKEVLREKSNINNRKMVSISNYDFF